MNLDQEFKSAFENPEELDLYLELITIDKRDNKNKNLMFLIAASISLLIGVLLFTQVNIKTTPSTETLFAENYTPFTHPDIYRGNQDNESDLLSKAIIQYSLSNYSKALSIFDSLLILDSNNNNLLLYTGICYIETKNFKSAILAFKKIIISKDPCYTETASWYMALSQLMNNEIADAKITLQHLNRSNGIYSRKSGKILKSLQKINQY